MGLASEESSEMFSLAGRNAWNTTIFYGRYKKYVMTITGVIVTSLFGLENHLSVFLEYLRE